MKIKESIKKFAKKASQEARVDIDIDYCKKHGIKYKNHERDASEISLFTTPSNLAAFDFVFKGK